MSDTNEKQWWKKYIPEKTENADRKYRTRYKIADDNNYKDCSLENLLKILKEKESTLPRRHFRDMEDKYWRSSDYSGIAVSRHDYERIENMVLAHEDCTEANLYALTSKANLGWEISNDVNEGLFIPGELNKWGKIFMDPHASEFLKECIIDGGDIQPEVIDYYTNREDCPKEFLSLAIQNTMSSFFHSYTRYTEYEVDAEKLKEIVAHPNMTEHAFEEALYIVAERMCSPADEVDQNNLPYHYQGEDDTCDLSRKDKKELMQIMLKNKACTDEIAIEIFAAAKETYLLDEIRDFAQRENLFPNAEKEMETRQAKTAREEEIESALTRVRKKSEDYLESKKAGDTELNKAVMKEKFMGDDVLEHKVAGKTQLNKRIMAIHNKLKRNTK